ncbi:MAG: ATP-binding protein [Candidatus Marinarcus sp.]|uniref:PAS domain-containing sensor histidine kinase n=1 Tax=Candidatus Marinarcus sp. TaxID=3100987 RepID=UPI003B00EF05
MLNSFSPAFKIAIIYLILSIVWISTSDYVVGLISQNPETINTLQTIKGWFFVSTTSLLIYILIHRFFKKEQKLNKHLEEQKKDFETIIQESPTPIMVYNEEGEVLIINKAWLELTGYSFEEIDTIEKWTNKAYKNKASEIKSIIENLYAINSRVDSGLVTIYTKSNEAIVWHFNSAPFGIKDNKRTIISSALDITELDKKNKLIIHQSKMAALGEMIENIAHQWRQPLSTISTIATGIEVKKEMDDLDDEYILDSMKIINNHSQYLSNTIDDFRKFFDKNPKKVPFNIKQSIEKSFELLYSRLRTSHIQIEKNLFDVSIYGLENEFIQVIINLINNAIDALAQTQDNKLIRIEMKKNEKEICITISDTGGGIEQEIIEKVFDPYFTTKTKNQGTGIGLYMSDEIISRHMNGKIEVMNSYLNYGDREYLGAKFIITLPHNTIS